MTRRVLVLGGTAEARRLAELLVDVPGWRVISSLAGAVANPLLPPGEVRVGGFGGLTGLVDWLRPGADAVVDATHPFAATITAHAAEATARLGLPFLVLRRPGWRAGPGDRWHRADDVDHAARLLPDLGRRVFLTTGRTGLAAFTALPDLWFLLRAIDPPATPPPPNTHLLLARGPYTVDGELALLRTHRIDVLVSKDSGGDSTAAKLAAARQLSLPVLLIRRPPPPPGVAAVTTPAEAVTWLTRLG